MSNKQLVLIVEDKLEWQKQLEKAVRRSGYECEITDDHQKARSIVLKQHPVAIVADINLRDWDPKNKQGFDFLAGFTKEERPPTIIVTGFGDMANVKFALRDLNVVEIFSKGDFNPQKFREVLESAVKERENKRK
jgi:DNA-binding NtrC family response regulator